MYFLRFSRISSYSFEVSLILPDALRFFQNLIRLSYLFLYSFGFFSYALGFYRNLWNYFRIHLDSLGFFEISRNLLNSSEFFQIFENSLEFPWIRLCFCQILSVSLESIEFSPIVLDTFGFLFYYFCFYRFLPNYFQILWNSLRFFRNIADFTEFFSIPLDSHEFSRIPFNSLRSFSDCPEVFYSFRILLNSFGFSRIRWNFLEFSKIVVFFRILQFLKESPGFFRTLPDSVRFYQILSNSLDTFGLFSWTVVFFPISNFY